MVRLVKRQTLLCHLINPLLQLLEGAVGGVAVAKNQVVVVIVVQIHNPTLGQIHFRIRTQILLPVMAAILIPVSPVSPGHLALVILLVTAIAIVVVRGT